MKKENLVLLLFILCILGGICLSHYFDLRFLGGFLTGSFSILALVCTIGKKQAEKAGQRIDKIINDQRQYYSQPKYQKDDE